MRLTSTLIARVMLTSGSIYQGGLPILPPTRRSQRGSGFLSSVKRFAMPLLRNAAGQLLPRAMQGVKNVIFKGQAPTDALKEQAMGFGGDLLKSALGGVASAITGRRRAPTTSQGPPAKRARKKAAPPPPPAPPARRKRPVAKNRPAPKNRPAARRRPAKKSRWS